MELHETLVHLAKTFGLVWMFVFFVVVAWLAYRPGARKRHEQAARSVLNDDLAARERT